MPAMAMPSAHADSSRARRPAVATSASHSASPEAAMPTADAGNHQQWARGMHVCAGVQRRHADVVHGRDAAAHERRRKPPAGSAVERRRRSPRTRPTPTTMTQTRNENSVGKHQIVDRERAAAPEVWPRSGSTRSRPRAIRRLPPAGSRRRLRDQPSRTCTARADSPGSPRAARARRARARAPHPSARFFQTEYVPMLRPMARQPEF